MWLILGIFLFILLLSLAIAAKSFAPWVPIRRKDLERIERLAGIGNDQIFYDLGCGNGRTVMYMARETGCRAVGIEMALPLYLICRFRQLLSKNSNIKFRYGNLFKADLSEANVIYTFGMPDKLIKLRDKLEHELKPGTTVISYAFPIKGWEPNLVDKPGETDIDIFVYQII